MSQSLDKSLVLYALQKLKRRDRIRKVFGAQSLTFGARSHNYDLLPPLSPTVVDDFERRHGVLLPEDYRYFVTEIGNGGAGPDYGLFPFGQQDDGYGFEPWESGHLIGDVSKPFPHVGAWNQPESFWEPRNSIPSGIPAEEEDRLMAEWDKIDNEHYWNPAIMNGAIPICHRGCALRQWLVVNGPQRGFVWNDFRADEGGVEPLCDKQTGRPMTFSDWYMSWLNDAVEECGLGRVLHKLFRRT